MDFIILAAQPQASFMNTFIWLIPMFLILYFFMLRPQTQRYKKHQAMVEGLKRGDTIVTQGGIIGKITKVDERDITVEISDGVKIKVIKSMVGDVYNPVAANDANATKK